MWGTGWFPDPWTLSALLLALYGKTVWKGWR